MSTQLRRPRFPSEPKRGGGMREAFISAASLADAGRVGNGFRFQIRFPSPSPPTASAHAADPLNSVHYGASFSG